MRRSDRYRFYIILLGLVVLQFAVTIRLWGRPVGPDFLLLGLLMYSIRAQPGRGAAAGFLMGLLRDALTPASFGAGALSHTIVGYLSAWGKAVCFAANVWVNGYPCFPGPWLRDLARATAAGRLNRPT